MRKDKVIKSIFIGLLFLVCGICYSCRREDSVSILTAEENQSDVTSTEESAVTDSSCEDSVSETISEEDSAVVEEINTTNTIYVYVCGEVVEPGVYECRSDARVYEAIEAAGGMTEDAAEDTINLADYLSDGQMITVFSLEEEMEGAVTESSTGAASQNADSETSADDKVNINTADADTLTTLPGIGSSKAASIIAYREQNNGFSTTEDIMNIEGIKEGVYNKIKDLIIVN